MSWLLLSRFRLRKNIDKIGPGGILKMNIKEKDYRTRTSVNLRRGPFFLACRA